MQTDKRDEIVKKAVELAKSIHDSPPTPWPTLYANAKALLTLAAPPEEPLPWPGLKGEPTVQKLAYGSWAVEQGDVNAPHGGKRGIAFSTRAEAIAEWNKVVRALSGGVDDETRTLMGRAMNCLLDPGSPHNSLIREDIRAWFASHPKGGGTWANE